MTSLSDFFIELLTRKYVRFQWVDCYTKAMDKLKYLIANTSRLLANFDENKMIILQCYSSKDELGCALIVDGQPVTFVPSFTDAERDLCVFCFCFCSRFVFLRWALNYYEASF